MTIGRFVDTPYGPMPGCPDCGVIKLHGDPHICEHGVTPAPRIEISVTMEVAALELSDRFLYGGVFRLADGSRIDPRHISPQSPENGDGIS